MQKTFTFFSDPGHGWVKVPTSILVALNIADKITHYSYLRGDFAYLEEDQDYTTFLNAFRAFTGKDPSIKESFANKYSKIRGYDTYSPERVA